MKLSDMSNEELWELFPIVLTEHREEWRKNYIEEAHVLREILRDYPGICMHHVGSTAIPGIQAKPIVDILIESPQEYTLSKLANRLESSGYICMSESDERISLNKGYTLQGFAEKVYHIHLRYTGDHDELYFRDYLQEHHAVAMEYETLKRKLAVEYEHNRDEYTWQKTDFVKKYTLLAKQEYPGKYER